MIKNWNLQNIKSEISKIAYAESNTGLTGFVTWAYKKELYEALWHIEDCLEQCTTYSEEEEFLKSREQQKLLKALGKK